MSGTSPATAATGHGRAPGSRGHSRATGTVRLVVAVWLIASSVVTFADPQGATLRTGVPLGTLLPVAGLSFTLGVFLLTGFMSRVCGLLLIALAVWQITFGQWVPAIIEAPVGLYLMLRGGGAWATDIYVQKMQDRVRRREQQQLS